MKSIMNLLVAAVLIFGLAAQSNADLTVVGSGTMQGVTGSYQLIYDSAQNITWLDYSAPLNTWQNQVAWAHNLTVNFKGRNVTGWSLPATADNNSSTGYNITSSPMGYLYYAELGNKGVYDANGNYQPSYGLTNSGPFKNLINYIYWSGTESSANPNTAWNFGTNDGGQHAFDKNYDYYALAVLPGNVAFALPATGQTTCYDTNGNVIECAGTGQDGALQEGVAWPSPRFTDDGDQTQTDELTGLIWPKDGSTQTSGSCTGGYMNWQGALNYVACLNTNNYLGHNDWRLPNVNELESLVNEGQSNPAAWLNSQGFINVQSYCYWSSTSFARNPSCSWYVCMNVGGVSSIVSKSFNFFYVWPVRGRQRGSLGNTAIWLTGQTVCYDTNGNAIACTGTGQDGDLQKGAAWPSRRFTDNEDQTVTDNLTNLTWTKDANAPGPSAWQGALDYVARLNANSYLGHNDWRLPNRKELYSLVDFSTYGPSLQTGNPFTNVQSGGYWSSTSVANVPSSAWYVALSVGFVFDGSKADNSSVWPVRGGQSGSLGYLVTPSAGIGGSISPSTPQTVTSGSTTAFTVTPNCGYSISSVTGCGGSLVGSTYTTGPITSNCTVTAAFALNTYTITSSAGANGKMSPSGAVTVNYDANETFTITANTYYKIADVKVDGVSVDPLGEDTFTYTFNNVTASHTISATFAAVNIAVTSPRNGAMWPRGSTQTISWTYTGRPRNVVSIELRRGGAFIKTINPRVAIGKDGSGSYKWHIRSKLPPGNDYQIKITSKDNGTFSDCSDGTFTIRKKFGVHQMQR